MSSGEKCDLVLTVKTSNKVNKLYPKKKLCIKEGFLAPNNVFPILSLYFQPPRRGHLPNKDKNCWSQQDVLYFRGSIVSLRCKIHSVLQVTHITLICQATYVCVDGAARALDCRASEPSCHVVSMCWLCP